MNCIPPPPPPLGSGVEVSVPEAKVGERERLTEVPKSQRGGDMQYAMRGSVRSIVEAHRSSSQMRTRIKVQDLVGMVEPGGWFRLAMDAIDQGGASVAEQDAVVRVLGLCPACLTKECGGRMCGAPCSAECAEDCEG